MMAKSLRALLSKLIKSYQLYISPMLGDHCRYYPSCSEYARQAIEAHGFFVGARLAIWRIMRCNPFSYGGVDHVPGCGHTSEDDSDAIAPQQSH